MIFIIKKQQNNNKKKTSGAVDAQVTTTAEAKLTGFHSTFLGACEKMTEF